MQNHKEPSVLDHNIGVRKASKAFMLEEGYNRKYLVDYLTEPLFNFFMVGLFSFGGAFWGKSHQLEYFLMAIAYLFVLVFAQVNKIERKMNVLKSAISKEMSYGQNGDGDDS